MFVLFNIFPREIALKIIEFESTYYELFNDCLKNLEKEASIIKMYWRKGYKISLRKSIT
tara:strand:- start:976 stop:1152 length:177 start_codon:yes stop_codon:yes gene_type:complete